MWFCQLCYDFEERAEMPTGVGMPELIIPCELGTSILLVALIALDMADKPC